MEHVWYQVEKLFEGDVYIIVYRCDRGFLEIPIGHVAVKGRLDKKEWACHLPAHASYDHAKIKRMLRAMDFFHREPWTLVKEKDCTFPDYVRSEE